jgi:UDP-N-acetylglucosamine 2-epimerase (non-hydrolysing)
VKKKVLIVFGTRPEAIKMIPVIRKLQKENDFFEARLCITAQHREMLDQVLDIFKIIPDYDLDLMKSNQDLFDITSNVLLGLRIVLDAYNPDIVLVHGDTTTTSAAALSSFYRKIPVGHVEAGLRTGNIYSPWPEEMNRKITGAISSVHFSPTMNAKRNLISEGVENDKIFVTGNTVIDALFMALNLIDNDKNLDRQIKSILENEIKIRLEELKKSRIILVTGHRRENFGEGFISICEALKNIAGKYPDVKIVYPVHLNPNVQKPVYKMLGDIPNIFLVRPLSYLPFIYLLKHSYLVLTDSGGIQEEAPGLAKPVLVMRNTTERPEAVEAGTVKLVGTDRDKIISEVSNLFDHNDLYKKMAQANNPYGDGKAAQRIVEILKTRVFGLKLGTF